MDSTGRGGSLGTDHSQNLNLSYQGTQLVAPIFRPAAPTPPWDPNRFANQRALLFDWDQRSIGHLRCIYVGTPAELFPQISQQFEHYFNLLLNEHWDSLQAEEFPSEVFEDGDGDCEVEEKADMTFGEAWEKIREEMKVHGRRVCSSCDPSNPILSDWYAHSEILLDYLPSGDRLQILFEDNIPTFLHHLQQYESALYHPATIQTYCPPPYEWLGRLSTLCSGGEVLWREKATQDAFWRMVKDFNQTNSNI